MSFPSLPVLTALPAAGALVVAFLPKTATKAAKGISLLVSLLVLAGSIELAIRWDTHGSRFQFVSSYKWIPQFGVRFDFGLDGIALVMLVLIGLLTPLVILAGWNDVERATGDRSVKGYFALILALLCCMVGVFAATDTFLFYVFFEAMLVPMYFLIGSYGGPRRQYAAVKFFLYSLVGGLFMLAALIALYVYGRQHYGGHGTFAFAKLAALHLDPATQKWLFLGFFIAFAIKAPLFPFHTWLPDAGGEAPIGAAVLLVGVLDKVGTYGFLRFCLPFFPDASRWFAPVVIVLSVVGIFYGSLLAIGQRDLKRFVSYTSVAHFGFIALGIFAFTSQGGSGAVFYMVNHGLSTGALFLVVGFLVARRGSSDIADFGGVGRLIPWVSGAFLLAGLSALALPGMSTFISEFLVLLGTFSANKPAGAIATVGIILAAIYVLVVYQRTMQGKLGPTLSEETKYQDMNLREAAVVGPLIALILVFGVYPKPVLDIINPAVKATLHDVGKHDPPPVHAPAPANAQGDNR
ncbi:MAG: NADH-quinone oxidoreductase subunit M [Mycobacteriales bacterium]